MIVTPIKNRKGYVQLLGKSFEFLRVYDTADVHLFDDDSSEFSIADLQRWFPRAKISSVSQSQADRSTREAFQYFLSEAKHDILVCLDSDGLLHPKWASFIYSTLPESDGVLSLYNSAAHPSSSCNEGNCRKDSAGALGMVFTRELITRLFMDPDVREADLFDWALVHKLNEFGIQFLVPPDSLILHFGMYGAHGSGQQHPDRENSFDLHPYPQHLKKSVVAFLKGKNPSSL